MKRTIFFALLACAAFAQDQDQPQDPQWQQWRVQQRAIFGADYNPGKGIMVLPIDQKVLQTLDKISAFESAKSYEDAARTYQALMEESGNKVLPTKDDPEFFLGVKAWCESRLMSSPDLLKAYRSVYDEVVQARIERAWESRDLATLRQIAETHFLASPAAALLVKLGFLEFENGDFEEALCHHRRCLILYPKSAADILPTMALCLWRLRDEQGLRDLLDWAKKENLDSLKVDSGTLAQLIEAKSKTLPVQWEYTRIPDHFRARPGKIGQCGLHWRQILGNDGDSPRIPNAYTQLAGGQQQEAFLLAAATSKRFIVNTNTKIHALDIANGKTVALREGDKTRYDPTTYVIRGFGDGESRPNVSFYGVTEKDGVVYCSLFRTQDTGKRTLLSVRNLEGFDYGQSRSLFTIKDRTLSMLAPPEPIGDSLYIGVSHREDNTTPPDNFVMRLDRNTGKILWSTFLCMNTGKNVPMFGPFNDAPPIIVTYHQGLLYVASNNGCVAVLDAAGGHIRWLRSYPQSRTGMMPAPPLIYGDTVIFGGVDIADKESNMGKVVAYDIYSGNLQWQRSFKIARDNPCYLEGISDGKLIISGPNVVCLNAKGGKILWKKDVMYKIVGKGALSNDAIYIPSSDGVEAYSLKDGEHTTVMTWGPEAKLVRGNLMLVENGFISYSDRCVAMFSPKAVPAPVKEKK